MKRTIVTQSVTQLSAVRCRQKAIGRGAALRPYRRSSTAAWPSSWKSTTVPAAGHDLSHCRFATGYRIDMRAGLVLSGRLGHVAALVGVIEAFEDCGYEWFRVAGLGVGGILAALLAAGYSARQLGEITGDARWDSLFQARPGLTGQYPPVTSATELLAHLVLSGAVSAEPLDAWLDGWLHQRGVVTFADLQPEDASSGRPRLTLFAADARTGRVVRLPDDLGLPTADSVRVVDAVGAAAAFPFVSGRDRGLAAVRCVGMGPVAGRCLRPARGAAEVAHVWRRGAVFRPPGPAGRTSDGAASWLHWPCSRTGCCCRAAATCADPLSWPRAQFTASRLTRCPQCGTCCDSMGGPPRQFSR